MTKGILNGGDASDRASVWPRAWFYKKFLLDRTRKTKTIAAEYILNVIAWFHRRLTGMEGVTVCTPFFQVDMSYCAVRRVFSVFPIVAIGLYVLSVADLSDLRRMHL